MSNLKCIYLFYLFIYFIFGYLFIYLSLAFENFSPIAGRRFNKDIAKVAKQRTDKISDTSPYLITTSKWVFWLYIVGVQLNFYQNITEICILFSNKVLGTTIHFILYAQHLTKNCQLEQKLK